MGSAIPPLLMVIALVVHVVGREGGHSPHDWLRTRVQKGVERVCFSDIGVVDV